MKRVSPLDFVLYKKKGKFMSFYMPAPINDKIIFYKSLFILFYVDLSILIGDIYHLVYVVVLKVKGNINKSLQSCTVWLHGMQ